MPGTIRDVARLAGVSVGTVSNVLNRPDDVSADSRQRVGKAIAELDYRGGIGVRRNPSAGTSTMIGLIIDDGANPFSIDVARAASAEASAQGLSLVTAYSDGDAKREERHLDLFLDHGARGVLIAPIGDVTPKLSRLRGAGVATVLIDRFSEDGAFSSVSVDNADGGSIAASHLVDSRRTRLAFVGALRARHMRDRLTGARNGVRNAAREATIEVIDTDGATIEAGVKAGEHILAREPHERPDGIFAGNDMIALGMIEALRRGGVRIPADIAVVGFDDIPFGSGASVALSTIRQPAQMIGRTAVRVLLEEAADPQTTPRQTVFRPQLIPRASTRGRGAHTTETV